MNLFSKIAAVVAVSLAMNTAFAANKEMEKYADGSNSFGLQVFKGLAQKKGNVLYSPVSMNNALSLVGHFASPKDKATLLEAMDYKNLTSSQFDEATQTLLEGFVQNKTPEYNVSIANSFWVDADFTMKTSDNVRNAKSVYSATVTNDFTFADPNTAAEMNKWVSEATQDRIKDLVTPAEVSPLDWAAISAIYFEGLWFHKFSTGPLTKFTAVDGSVNDAQYLEGTPSVLTATIEYNGAQVYELGYGKMDNKSGVEQKASMIIVQPANPADLKALVAGFDVKAFNAITKELNDQKSLGNSPYISLNIPAFELDFTIETPDVKSVLENNGAGVYFQGFDMTSLNDMFNAKEGNKIKLIKQKANITVANTGTIAAAASFVGGGIESMGPQTVYVNSAFMYFIVDKESNVILFAGTLTDTKSVKVPQEN